MKSQNYPIGYFQLMAKGASALAGFPAQILQQSYNYESFGSWWFSFRFKGQELRVVFDGKDGTLFLQKKVASEWNEIQSRQTKEPNPTDVLNLIGEAIKRA
jgi:hypothetical protein